MSIYNVSATTVNTLLSFSKANYTDISSSLSWSTSGTPTLISNNPEISYAAGYLYEDSTINSNGRFRIFWEHKYAISGSAGGYIGFFLFNNTGSTIKVNLGKYGKSVDSSSITAGQQAVASYLRHSSAETEYATVLDGNSTYLSFYTETGSTCVGLYDVVIRDTAGNLVTGGVTVKTFMSYKHPRYFLEKNPSLLPKSGSERRGTVNYDTKSISWTNAQKGTSLTFCSTANNNWSVPASDKDHYNSVVDSISGGSYYGGYGLILDITVTFAENNSFLAISPCVLGSDQNGTLSGGTTTHKMVVSVNGNVMTSDVPNSQMWVIATGDAGSSVHIQTTLTACDYAPMRLIVLS